jgi:hypothetical protein
LSRLEASGTFWDVPKEAEAIHVQNIRRAEEVSKISQGRHVHLQRCEDSFTSSSAPGGIQ